MAMPLNLILVRHGESEGNVATALSKKGDDSKFTEEFLNRHSSTWRLTPKGVQQAIQSGDWVKQNIGGRFHRCYVSDYDRAKETAAGLGLTDAEWFVTYYLVERCWGDLDVMPFEERKQKFKENLRRKSMDPFYWVPTNGESMLDLLCSRLERILDTLHRECDGKDAIMVVHGEVMWGFRYILERMSHAEIMRLEHSDHPHDKIHNGQILHYTRKNPVTGEAAPYLNWMRSICPSDLTLSSNGWKVIERKRFTNDELIEQVELRHIQL
ncbi:phosphoglycerate mutase family protein [Candidatus Falkowbacteria bacterium]|nr:phosphoglycerate mutase family protein [Candidatus Falkowbacteria bacterium]